MNKLLQTFFDCITGADKEPPKPEPPPACSHDYHLAGPVKNLSCILQELYEDGYPDLCYSPVEDGENPRVISIYINSSKIHRSSVSMYELTRLYGNWHDYEYQGKICLNCGDCVDVLKDKKMYWKDRLDELRDKKELNRKRAEIADKMWADSTCSEED